MKKSQKVEVSKQNKGVKNCSKKKFPPRTLIKRGCIGLSKHPLLNNHTSIFDKVLFISLKLV